MHSPTFNVIFAMSYFGSAAAAASPVCGPRLQVQAVRDGEERNVVVPQLGPDSLCEHPMQQCGLLEIHLFPNTDKRHRESSDLTWVKYAFACPTWIQDFLFWPIQALTNPD